MLADAARAEAYRLSKNRIQIGLSVFLTPLLFVLGGLFLLWQARTQGGAAAAAMGLNPGSASAPLNLADTLIASADKGANGLMLVLMLVAAATLYAGDYRWETWRLISARNGRTSLLGGKLLVMTGLALAGMVVFQIAGLIVALAQAAMFERSITFDMSAGALGDLVLTWLLSWLRIVQYVMIALLTAVVSRSLLAALFVPWALGFVQTLLGQLGPAVFGWEPQGWTMHLLLPGHAYDALKTLVVPPAGPVPGPAPALWPALTSLVLWTLLPLLAALAWFRRQDLAKE
ncbi:hypothetical protein [Brevundimonas sp. PAMC22021]|uniref:hypothetical protein n=1 Tax=Brevundimonas sp. PAMC22021 TaxID=2861285 RepID=UPI001C6357DA|nr:hypothetical protein [Brevundimonas sp. PAMC22021]QYF85737.1 hypothetical protein KY493_07585 [Brevundimonas sp. PAMC22021]